MNSAERFLKAKEELADFYAQNIEILSDYERLKEEVAIKENELREEARKLKRDLEAGPYMFQFIPRWRKWVDYHTAITYMNKDERAVLDEITEVKREVDFDEFVKLVRLGVLPEEARVYATHEEELASQVKLVNPKRL